MKFKIYGKQASMTLLGQVNGEWHVMWSTPLGAGNFQHVFDSENPFPKKSEQTFEMPARPVLPDAEPKAMKGKPKDKAE